MKISPRLAALSFAIAMLSTSLVFVAPAAEAQEPVPTQPQIILEPVPNLRQVLYLRFPNVSTGDVDGAPVGSQNSRQPNCAAPEQGELRIDGAGTPQNAGYGRPPCSFTTSVGDAAGQQTVTFTTPPAVQPNRRVNFTGNSSFWYHHEGRIPDGVRLSVRVQSDVQDVATGFVEGDDEADAFTVRLTLAGPQAITGRVEVIEQKPLRVILAGIAPPGDGLPIPGNLPTWTIDDRNTYVELRAENAIRTALWLTNEKNELKDVFAPFANDSQRPEDKDKRFVAHFALQSAFGYEDAKRGAPPEFTVLFNDRPKEVGTGGQTVLVGVLNESRSVTASGLAVWSFEESAVHYRGFQGGEYRIHVEKTHHQGGAVPIADKRFAITAQSVTLGPYIDHRTPTVRDFESHTVVRDSSTTYLLAVNNTGAVHDNFTVNVSTANAPAGWGVTVAGPDVQGRRIFVPKGETRIFTVTVSPPRGATSGNATHIVNVTSTVDPGIVSLPLALSTSIGAPRPPRVAPIVLARDLTLEPGTETHFPVYIWNDGSEPANVSLAIQETPIVGWNADLLRGNAGVRQLVVSGIQPGGIAETTLRITGPSSTTINTHSITLNATNTNPGVAGISGDRQLNFVLRSITGVQVQILSAIGGGHSHIVEVVEDVRVTNPTDNTQVGYVPQCNPNTPEAQRLDCREDGVDGIWFRVWVTNTGKITDTFVLTGDAFTEARGSGCDGGSRIFSPNARADNPMTGDFGFFYRSPAGVHSGRNVIENLAPGATGELYVYLPVDRYQDLCPDTTRGDDFFSFVVQAKGQNTQAIGRAAAEAVARNNGGQTGVYLEGVVRDSRYGPTSPLVDPANVSKRAIVGAVEPGKNVTYFVRMTNAASWAEYTENNRIVRPDLKIRVKGVDPGWNVSIRPVLENTDLLRNPYGAEYNFSNINEGGNNRREAWFDRELEVVVQAPSIENGTALANIQDQIFIEAYTNGTGGSTLEIQTVIAKLANVTARTDETTTFAHPGEAGAFLLYVTNNGSSEARVTLRASMAEGTPAAGWQLSPNAEVFTLSAFKNRTVALLVTPPVGAGQGTLGEVNVTLSYARNPDKENVTTNISLPLRVQVVPPRNIDLTTTPARETTIKQAGTATFPMTIRNTGSVEQPFRVTATQIPNWTVRVSPESGTLAAGASQPLTLVMIAPRDVTNNSRFASIVRASDPNDPTNFDGAAFGVSIEGGTAIPNILVPNLAKRVPRAGVQTFEVAISNVGSTAGTMELELRRNNPDWIVGITNAAGAGITSVTLNPNEVVNVNVSVRAPRNVTESTVEPIRVIAYAPDRQSSAEATLVAEIQDYGVSLQILPSTKDGMPGLPTEFQLRVRNTGNDNDTLNVSANLIDLPEWSVAFSVTSQEVRLEPNQTVDITATIRSPTTSLPTPRAYAFPFWVGTREGQKVNLTKNMTLAAVVTIPNYRQLDVDRDQQVEIAVDLDKRPSNGFEEFREIFTTPTGTTRMVENPLFEGKTTFFLDLQPDAGTYDGVADVWFNPETVQAFEIEHFPDLNGDGTPDYLLDTDRDGKIDKAYDSATERFWDAFELSVYGDERIQYLVDTTQDGRPDRFYDPETTKVTRTTSPQDLGRDYVGIDVNDDDRVDYYYNTRTRETSGAEVQNFGGFARTYWYFFAVFAALVILTVALVVRRARKK